jgi:hypothetical protein
MSNNRFKFRSWDKKTKSMRGIDTIRQVDFVLMQFTGLKDKHKIDVYEDDIIKYQFNKQAKEYIGPVFYNSSMASFQIKTSDVSGFSLLGQQQIIEVIGNIHETPRTITTNYLNKNTMSEQVLHQWDYCIHLFDTKNNLTNNLNILGCDRWELISINTIEGNSQSFFYFKRPKHKP